MTGLHTLDPNPSGQPTVLLMHGLGAESTSWILQMPVLSEAGFRPIAPDAPGFGSSPYDGSGWNIRRVAVQMSDLLGELGSGPAHIVGLSMGGVIAQQFALDFPQLTRKLVLVSTFTVLRPQGLKGWAYFIRRAAALLTRGMNAQAQVVARHIFPEPQDEGLREMYLASVRRANPQAYRRAMLALGSFDSSKRLGEIHAPTLVISGSEDGTIPPERQKKLSEGIPSARQVIIPKAGHAVSVDQAERFNQLLLDFLKRMKSHDMKYETLQNIRIPKIGFGTWKLGGESQAEPALESRSMNALRSALELGYTHFDTAEYYAGGHAEELLGRAVREAGLPRESLFITTKVSQEHLRYADVLHSCENSLRRLDMDFIDLYLIHWPSADMDLADTFRALNKLVRDGKVRHLGVSNFNLKLLKHAVSLSETELITNQVSYSLPDRTCVENGVLGYCQENDILLTAYSPVKRRFIRGDRALQELARSRGATPQQIALAWLVRQPRVITIPMSLNPQHQAENLAAADIVLSEAELAPFRHL